MKVVIIADDITGALDTASAFAARGLRTICALTARHLPAALDATADVVAVSTGTREVSAERAALVLGEVAKRLNAHPVGRTALRFKKIDSRLKGHVALETGCVRRGDEPLTLCPAVPALGRLSLSGVLIGEGVVSPLPITAVSGLFDAEVLDAQSQEALDAAVAQLDLARLFVGAAGLASALAARLSPGRTQTHCPPLQAPALFAIGSRDPVTLAQLARLDVGQHSSHDVPDGRLQGSLPAPGTIEILRMSSGSGNLEPAVAAGRFAETIAERIRETRPALLVACGGETGGAILGRLDCGLLDVLGEALPGVPVARPRDGAVELLLLTKSGGFGDPEMLVRLIGKVVNSNEVMKVDSEP